MRTTLDLPDDVAETLRRESARRGGRAKAPMTKLISDAVRKTYGPSRNDAAARIIVKPGRGLVVMPPGIKITSRDTAAALEEAP